MFDWWVQLQDSIQHNPGLGACQGGTGTEMDAVAEGDVASGPVFEDKFVGTLEYSWISVGARDADEDLHPGVEVDSTEFGLLLANARHELNRAV